MELAPLIDALSSPAAYPGLGADRVEVIQTHISVVFLVGEHVFKLKKPVKFAFVDYSTPARRRELCAAEVALNRRLAADVYLGVVPVTCSNGHVQIGGEGEVIDHVVHMRRLPDERTLEAWLARGGLPPGTMAALGRRLAAFHREAARGPEIAAHGDLDAVAGNCRDNFSQTAALGLEGIPAALLDRLAAATDAELARQGPTIAARAARGVPCDSHGDLRLDHVYLFPERVDDPLVIIDCIEFNDAFRYGDPAVDLAFLVMDLRYHGHLADADALVASYVEAADDAEAAALLPLYTAYRASVRGKVEAFRASEPEIPAPARQEALRSSIRHFLLALRELDPARGPALLLIAGLPGTGKSTLAAGLAEPWGAATIRSDVVRKGLAGLAPDESGRDAIDGGIYAPEMTARTYAACLEEARAHLSAGEPVIVDANFKSDDQRQPFAELAAELGVPLAFLVCEAGEAVILGRLAARRGDASDADEAVYLHAREQWEAPTGPLAARSRVVDASGSVAETRARAQAALAALAFPCEGGPWSA
ncbi:MAG: AAA family ATPase [Myxococcales bacterium]|nr:AAA family ATPase [Myxococcales bacterium]